MEDAINLDDSLNLSLIERDDIIPESIQQHYSALDESFKYMTETELRNNYKYTITDERLRASFWREVQKSAKTGQRVVAKRVYANICSDAFFYQKFLKNPHKLAWMMQPMTPYESATNALLNMAVGRYEEIITMNITDIKKTVVGVDDDGKPIHEYLPQVNVSKANLLLATINKLEDRVKGMAVQKNLNIAGTAPKEGAVVGMDMKALDARLEELRSASNDKPWSKKVEAIETTCEVSDENE